MTNNYDMLFTPFKIGKMEVKNRIVMSPMGTNTTGLMALQAWMKSTISKRGPAAAQG